MGNLLENKMTKSEENNKELFSYEKSLKEGTAKGPIRLEFFLIMGSFLVKRKIILTLNFNF